MTNMSVAPIARDSPASHHHRACPICESGDLTYEFSVEHVPTSSCARCGLLFLDPASAAVPVRPAFRDVYEVNVANAVRRLDWLERYLATPPRRLLLVNADSIMREEAERRGFDVVEMHVDELERATAALTAAGSLQAAVLCCALETASDPRSVLASARRLLEPGGALMVIAPSLDSRTARLFRANWWEFTPRNRFYFSVDTLQCLLARMQFGQPIVLRENSVVTIQYLQQKLAHLTAWRFAVLRTLLSPSPGFLSRRVFASLDTRTVMLVRAELAPARPRISVVMPVYNEAATFEQILDAVLRKSIDGVDIEVVVVESHSTDGTREIALKYRDHPRVRLILEDKPSGKGHAVRRGLAEASGDVIVIQDADLEYEIDDYDALVAPILNFEHNFVIGSRHTDRGSLWKMREFNDAAGLAAFFNAGHMLFLGLFNAIYRQRLKDPFSMFKVFRRQCLYGLAFECRRFDFDFELVIKLLRKGYRVLELPVNYHARSFSDGKKVHMFHDPVSWLRALIKFRFSALYGPWTGP